MPDYSLGRAHGEVVIDYDGDGADRAAAGLDKVAASSEATDKSLAKTEKTLGDTDRQFRSSGDSAAGYGRRLKDVEDASRDLESAERRHRSALLDSRATLDDVKGAEDRVSAAKKRHAEASEAARDAQRAYNDALGVSEGAVSRLANVVMKLVPGLNGVASGLGGFSNASADASDSADGLSGALGGVASGLAMLGPQGRAAAVGLELAGGAAGATLGVFKQLAGFEVAFGQIAGTVLGAGSLAGLAGLGGASAVQGIINLAEAARELSGSLGLLPAVISAVELSTQTLSIAFHGVGDALSDMMSDDPKKFLEDIKDMGPVAAQAMLQVAQFRDQFRLAGGAIQDSFFAQIAGDIKPLIQEWLPAVASGMSQIAGVFGEAAHQLAGLLSQPAALQAFQSFVTNVSAGLRALEPAIAPLMEIFTQLTVIGSSFFGQIGGDIAQFLGGIAGRIDQLASSGQLQSWIQTGVDSFGRLVDIVGNVGGAFMKIMDIADNFGSQKAGGGGGLLGWLVQLTDQFKNWTESVDGQDTLVSFFSTIRQATDAFVPLLKPLVEGLASIGGAIVNMGTAASPGFQSFFDSFAATMKDLGPDIEAIGPSLGTFASSLGNTFQQLMADVGPRLPQLFKDLADAFVSLLPQVQPLVDVFLDLAEKVGPLLPRLFGSMTSLIQSLLPYVPVLTGAISDLVNGLTWFVKGNSVIIDFFTNFLSWIHRLVDEAPALFSNVIHTVTDLLFDLPDKALDAGKSILANLAKGLADGTGIGSVINAVTGVAGTIYDHLFTNSPARRGPLHDTSPDQMGINVVRNFASGMAGATPIAVAAAAGTAGTVSAGLSGAAAGVGGAPSPGGSSTVGGALLPDNIANADTSILTAYLRHQFSDTNGLKGLAKDLGKILEVAQSGANLIAQNVLQPLFQGLGMLSGSDDKTWRKMSPEELAAQQQKTSAKDAAKGPTWTDVFGQGAPGTGSGDFPWDKVAAAESSGNWQNADTGNNGHYGGLQFSPETWKAFGGLEFAPMPNQATREQQIAVANRTAFSGYNGTKPQGLGAWETITKGMVPGVTVNTPASGPGAAGTPTGSSWAQVNGAPPTTSQIADYSNWYPAPGAPTGTQSPGTYGLPTGTNTGGYGTGSAKTFPEWVMALAEQFGVKPSTYAKHQETDRNEAGYAPNPNHLNRGIDWSGSVENMQRFAEFLSQNAPNMPGLEQIIWQNPNTMQKIGLGGAGNPTTGYFPDTGVGSYAEHQNHVHTRQSAPLILPGNGTADYANWYPGTAAPAQQPGIGTSVNSGLVLPSGQTLGALTDTSQKNLSVNDKLLQSYLQGNPALAAQIDAAKTPGAPDATVTGALTGITKTIDDLKSQDAVGNKNTIDALQSAQSGIAQQQGFTSGPSQLSQAQSLAGGISGAISGVFKSIGSGLDALAATQDFADRLVYGVRNTEDIAKFLIDDVQKWITYAADVISTVGSIVSTVGSFTGGADFGGTSAAGSALSLIASVLQGVNAAIDFGQQVYEITMGYVGKFVTVLGGLGGTDLMGNVGFLLNKNTGELLSYSQDNPGQQNSHKVPSWLNSTYDYNGRGNSPQINQQLNVYAGPGQSPGEMMNETMWMVNTQGTTGAMNPANF